MPEKGDLKVWHIPQIPGKPFEVAVQSVAEGSWLRDVLAKYDLFQLKHNIKPDYANANGIMVFEDGEWTDFHED